MPRQVASAYPEEKQLDAVLDFARALGVSDECLRGLQEVIDRERASGTGEAR